MVSEDDLIRTVSEAFAQGWRQVKLYFMCGLPTEEDDDVVQIADMAHNVIRAGRAASGSNDVRCTISIGGFVPKPHTPFQWAAQAHPDVVDARLRKLREAVNADRKLGRNVGMRYHDGQPSLIEGLLARGDRRVGAGDRAGVARRRPVRRLERALLLRAVGRRLRRRAGPSGVSLDWFTTRERDRDEVLPWDHLDSGLERDWLWDDWQDALAGREQDDCRWTPCFDCGVCPSTGTDIEVGPSGTTLLPLTPVNTPSGEHRAQAGWLSPTSSYGWPTSATRPPSPGCAAPGWRSAPGIRSTTRGSRPRSPQWWRLELPRRTFWLAEAGSERSGWTRGGLDQRRRDRAHASPRSPRRADRAGRQRVRAQRLRRPRGARARCWPGAVEHARERRYRRLVLAPTGSSAPFYLRAGFDAAGESLLVLDPTGRRRLTCTRTLLTWRASGPERRRTRHLPRSSASACASPSAGGCASCPIATSRAASSGPCGGRASRSRTRTGSPRTRGCRGSGPRRPGPRARPSTWRSGSPARSTPPTLAAALDAALPDGLDVLAAAVAEGTPLAERIEASEWRIELPGVASDDLRGAVAALEAADTVVVERVTPSGRRQIDVRGRARRARERVSDTGSPTPGSSLAPGATVCAIMTAVVRQTTPAVRPDDVLGALDVVAGLKPPVPAKATRMAQGLLDDRGRLADPLGPDRVTTRV